MATVDPEVIQHEDRSTVKMMSVSAYDIVASWLVALLFIVGFAVGLMFLIWLTTVIEFRAPQSNVVLVENAAGRGDHAKGYERDIEAPGQEELEEETEPQVEQLLEAVTDMVSTQAASLDAMATDAVSSNKGDGVGDSRPPGPLGEGDDIIPRFERWKIQYNTTSLNAYAQQLDYFKIELGAAGGGKALVDYAANFTRGGKTRQGKGDAEKRLYMTWTSGTLKRFDKDLLKNAGVKADGRITMQFYPKEIENQIALIEHDYMTKNSPHKHVKYIKQTVLGVRKRGAGYEYYVISQAYRNPSA